MDEGSKHDDEKDEENPTQEKFDEGNRVEEDSGSEQEDDEDEKRFSNISLKERLLVIKKYLVTLRQSTKMEELDEQLREYIEEWRKQRSKEEDELKRLKEKQVKRKQLRKEEEKRLMQKKREEELRRQREIEEKKQKDADEKLRRLEEAEKKRQAMMKAQQDKNKGPNFTIQRGMKSTTDDPRAEFNKPKELLEEEKKVSLAIRIKALN
ncbi:unnamed protein product, partial [Notodromas monacha]